MRRLNSKAYNCLKGTLIANSCYSGCGKTQLLLHLLLAVQLPPPHGLSQGALYISTEGELPTSRLAQLLSNHPLLSSPPDNSPQPSLENIRSITTVDLESQDHILNFQVPVAIERYNIGLVVVDSITANYRAELSADNPEGLIARARELKVLGHFLRSLAVKYNIAVVVANQVSDQFGTLDDPMWTEVVDEVPEDANTAPPLHQKPEPSSIPNGDIGDLQSSPSHMAGPLFVSSSPSFQNGDDNSLALDLPSLDAMLALDHQKPFFTGWGDPYSWSTRGAQTDVKAPALGLVWTNQIACRVILKIKPEIPSIILPQPEANQREKTKTEICPLSSAPVAVVPDSEDSDDGGGEASDLPKADKECDADAAVSGFYQPHPQLQDVVEEGAVTEQVPNNNTFPMASATNPMDQPSPTSQDDPFASFTIFSSRRIREMEVVFSPWTSGNPHQYSDGIPNDDGWEDVDEHEVAETQDLVTKYEPSAADTVEFEILSGGIRGLT